MQIEPRAQHNTQGGDFGIFDGAAGVAEADDGGNSSGLFDFGALRGIEAPEDVAGEDQHFNGTNPVDPNAPLGRDGGQHFNLSKGQGGSGQLLKTRANSNREPAVIVDTVNLSVTSKGP